MNSLNILSGNRSTPPPSPARSRASSQSNPFHDPNDALSLDDEAEKPSVAMDGSVDREGTSPNGDGYRRDPEQSDSPDEKAGCLSSTTAEQFGDDRPWVSRWLIHKRVAEAVVGSLQMVAVAVTAPARYVLAYFRDDEGRFTALMPLYKIGGSLTFKGTRVGAGSSGNLELLDSNGQREQDRRRDSSSKPRLKKSSKRSPSVASSSAITSDSELDNDRLRIPDSPSRHTRSKSASSTASEEIAPAKRSIRIKLHNEDALKQRRARKAQGSISKSSDPNQTPTEAAAAALKSPTSPTPSAKLTTKFPRAPQPPRPLVPRRQPSYSTSGASAVGPHQKTLIIDLDETLIHSMAKGGRYTTGHMVEVKLQQPVGIGGTIIGPQVPILYYVHKRPHCDEFLRKVCKWYNLVVFTASVQEYADPVIDWLELERKYFVGRYYRQHCTFRNGAYIKDLSQVEPDLSKVMIVDNSPMSYVLHEDNAIPIEGWISDPTDNDLLHLIPLLEGLQYVTDVRALLGLRNGVPN